MIYPTRVSRAYVLDRVRRIALHALWSHDMERWDRATAILDRDAKRKLARYTAREVAHA